MDKNKFKKINWERLVNHPIVDYFIKNPKEEGLFMGNLISYRADKGFLSILDVKFLGDDDIEWLINEIKERYITKKVTRRGFLGWLGIGVASAGGAFAAQRYGLWPFKSNETKKELEQKSKSEETYAKILYKELSRNPRLNLAKNPLLSNDPNAPIVIIIEDIHGGEDKELGWQIEFQKLEFLRKSFGLNFVGIEGWAGHEVDTNRGRK